MNSLPPEQLSSYVAARHTSLEAGVDLVRLLLPGKKKKISERNVIWPSKWDFTLVNPFVFHLVSHIYCLFSKA